MDRLSPRLLGLFRGSFLGSTFIGFQDRVLLHSTGKFCDSTREFLGIISGCAPELLRLLVRQNHLQHRHSEIQL
jgi:hypothetical protein